MKTAMPAKQCGLSFVGFIFGAFLLVLVGIFVMKLIPAYIQNAKVETIFVEIANDPEMQQAAPRDIRMSFNKRARIDDVTAITAENIKIANIGGRPVLSADYDVKIPLVGNISLYLEFRPTSAK